MVSRKILEKPIAISFPVFFLFFSVVARFSRWFPERVGSPGLERASSPSLRPTPSQHASGARGPELRQRPRLLHGHLRRRPEHRPGRRAQAATGPDVQVSFFGFIFFWGGGLLRWVLQLGLGVADSFFFWGAWLLRWVLQLGLGVADSCFFFLGGLFRWVLHLGLGVADSCFFFFFLGGGLLRWVLQLGLGVADSFFFFFGGGGY